MSEQQLTDWILLNKSHIYMLLLAIKKQKQEPMAPQFAEILRQAETKLRDSLNLMKAEEEREG